MSAQVIYGKGSLFPVLMGLLAWCGQYRELELILVVTPLQIL